MSTRPEPEHAVSLHELADLEVRLLERICRDGPYDSIVRLAADEWRGTGDAVGEADTLAWVLYGLCDQGLLVIRESTVQSTYALPITYVRATPDAYSLLDYPPPKREVGRGRITDDAMRPGDMTEFRNHGEQALPAPIERMPIAEHMQKYPTHWFHRRSFDASDTPVYSVAVQPVELRGGGLPGRDVHAVRPTLYNRLVRGSLVPQRPQDREAAPIQQENHHPSEAGNPMTSQEDMTRTYKKVDADMIASIMLAKTDLGPTASYGEIAEETGYTPRQVRYVLTTAPLMRRMGKGEEQVAASLKDRIIMLLTKVGDMKTVPDMRTVLGHADTEHDIVHVLHSLKKEGRVTFREGTGSDSPVNIGLSRKHKIKGYHPRGEEPLTPVEATDPEGIIGRGMKVEAQPEVATLRIPYPLLDALIEREELRKQGDPKAIAYLQAAEAIKDIDPEAADSLMAKATQFDIPFPSPVEAEYLRFADDKATILKGDTDVQPE